MWLVNFLSEVVGYDANVTLAFTQVFNDRTTKIGDVAFEITKDFIDSVTKLPQIGERWF